MKTTQSKIDFKLRLIEHARQIVIDAKYFEHSDDYTNKIFTLAERIEDWIEKDRNETK